MTITQLLYDIRNRLTPTLGDFALPDAEAIIQEALDISRTRLYTDTSIVIGGEILKRLNDIVERRKAGEPLPYILGKTYFYDREFFVDKNVLIPRPDTEVLVETILNTEKKDSANFIDLGTGSGIIPTILTAHRPNWSAVAVDISYNALRTAKRNVSTNTLLICGDMLTAIKPNARFDFLVSNPPYISSSDMQTLDKSVLSHEPHTALHGGNDGLDYYKLISRCAKMYLKDDGRVYVEIGYDQGKTVPSIFLNDGWGNATVIKDLGNRDRVVIARCF